MHLLQMIIWYVLRLSVLFDGVDQHVEFFFFWFLPWFHLYKVVIQLLNTIKTSTAEVSMVNMNLVCIFIFNVLLFVDTGGDVFGFYVLLDLQENTLILSLLTFWSLMKLHKFEKFSDARCIILTLRSCGGLCKIKQCVPH